jgi:hypothetical protein
MWDEFAIQYTRATGISSENTDSGDSAPTRQRGREPRERAESLFWVFAAVILFLGPYTREPVRDQERCVLAVM